MFDPVSLAVGAVLVGAGYFLYLAATKGLPAAVTWVKAKWNAGKAELDVLKADVAGAGAKVDALEKGAVAELQAGLATVKSDVATLKQKVATPPAAPIAAAPIPQAAPAQPGA